MSPAHSTHHNSNCTLTILQNNHCDSGSQASSLLEPVLVVLHNLVDAVLTLLVQLCQTEVKGHQGGILLHAFLDQSATCLWGVVCVCGV